MMMMITIMMLIRGRIIMFSNTKHVHNNRSY